MLFICPTRRKLTKRRPILRYSSSIATAVTFKSDDDVTRKKYTCVCKSSSNAVHTSSTVTKQDAGSKGQTDTDHRLDL